MRAYNQNRPPDVFVHRSAVPTEIHNAVRTLEAGDGANIMAGGSSSRQPEPARRGQKRNRSSPCSSGDQHVRRSISGAMTKRIFAYIAGPAHGNPGFGLLWITPAGSAFPKRGERLGRQQALNGNFAETKSTEAPAEQRTPPPFEGSARARWPGPGISAVRKRRGLPQRVISPIVGGRITAQRAMGAQTNERQRRGRSSRRRQTVIERVRAGTGTWACALTGSMVFSG